jgi:hypothetical protein
MNRPPLETLLPPEMTELRWRPLMTFFLDIKPPYNLGKTPVADRRIAELPGGYFQGDSAWMINVRTLLETDDGALIGMTYTGLRHGPKDVIEAIARGERVSPLAYYMRVSVVFETAAEKYAWLNRAVSVAHGHRLPTGAIYNVFEII